MNDGDRLPHGELLFIQLITSLQAAAMQHMGKLVNPMTNEVERDLEQAKFSIDMLDALKERTKGNLGTSEDEFLSKVLFELHMNYVDEAAKPPEADDQEASSDTGEQPEPEKTKDDSTEKKKSTGKNKPRDE